MTENSRSILNESVSALVDGESNDFDVQRILNAMDEEGRLASSLSQSGEAKDGEAGGLAEDGTANEEDKEDKEEGIRQTWSRYHAMSSVMKNEPHVDLSIDLSLAIRDAIAEEASPQVKRFSFNAISQGIGKTAVAAAVTFGVVFGVQQYTTAPEKTAPIYAEAGNTAGQIDAGSNLGAVVPQGFELPPLSARTVSTNSLADEVPRARSLLVPLPQVLPQRSIVISSEQFQEQMNRLMHKHAEQVSSSGGMGLIPFARVSNFTEEEKD